MELYLVRHGQSEANAAKIMQGAAVDRPLTSLGKQQAQITKNKLAGIHFDRIYASPLRRASQTAAIITGNGSTVTFDPRLVEFDYGNWDGQPIQQLVKNYPQFFNNLSNFRNSWKVSGGEKYSDTKERLNKFMSSLDTGSDQKILVVSHGMTIKLWVSFLLKTNSPERMAEPANAGVTHFTFYNGIPILREYSH